MVSQVILKSEPVHPFGLAVYGEHIFWTDWVRRAVQRANKYVGSDMKLLRVDIPQQPMGIIAVANDTNSCEWGHCHQPCPAHCAAHASVDTYTHTLAWPCSLGLHHTGTHLTYLCPQETSKYLIILQPPRCLCVHIRELGTRQGPPHPRHVHTPTFILPVLPEFVHILGPPPPTCPGHSSHQESLYIPEVVTQACRALPVLTFSLYVHKPILGQADQGCCPPTVPHRSTAFPSLSPAPHTCRP